MKLSDKALGAFGILRGTAGRMQIRPKKVMCPTVTFLVAPFTFLQEMCFSAKNGVTAWYASVKPELSKATSLRLVARLSRVKVHPLLFGAFFANYWRLSLP